MIGDDAPHDCQPEPRPGPDILGRVERLEDVDLCRTRYPRSVVGDLDDYTRAFHVRPDGDASASVHSVYGIVDQVGPYLVQLAAVPRYPGQVFLVLPQQRYVLQPRTEDGEGVLQAGDHIDLPYNRPVHVGVLFHRPDQLEDTPRASLDLTGQADEIQRPSKPLQTTSERAVTECLGHRLQTVRVHARLRQGRRQIPRFLTAMVSQPIGELILGVAKRERVEEVRVARGRFTVQGHERLALPGGEALVVPYGGELGLEDRPAQFFGGPPRCRCGIVSFVGKTGRELAQGSEFLLLAVSPLGVAHAPGQARDEHVGHVWDLDGQAPEGLRVDLQNATRRGCPRPVDRGPPRQHREPAGELAGSVVQNRDLLSAVETRDFDLPFEHDVEAVHDGPLVEEEVSGLQAELTRVRHQHLDLRGRENLLLPSIRHHASAPMGRSLSTVPCASPGSSTGNRTWKRVSLGSERTRMSPLWSSTTTR